MNTHGLTRTLHLHLVETSSLFHLKCYLLFGLLKLPLVVLVIMITLLFVLSLIRLKFVVLPFGNSMPLFYRIMSFVLSLRTEFPACLFSCIDYFPSVKSWWDFFKTSLTSEIVFFSRIRRRCLSRERDILDHIELTLECAILVSLDQERAFDRVDRSFLLDVLRSYGFDPDFCDLIFTFYHGALMKILLNDWLTDKIPLERGVRQGDPLSPLLYVLCVEVLANLICRSPEISGFYLPGAKEQQVRVRLYADDTTCVIKDVRSLTKLFECVHVYDLGSGGKLNRSKTEAMWLGAWMSRADEPLGLTWVRKMKALGVSFGTVAC